MDKHTEINGENYLAVILVLLTFPNVLVNEIFIVLFGKQVLRLRLDPALILAIVLTTVYIILTEIADRKSKKKQIEIAQFSSFYLSQIGSTCPHTTFHVAKSERVGLTLSVKGHVLHCFLKC